MNALSTPPVFPPFRLSSRAYERFDYLRRRWRGFATANPHARCWWLEGTRPIRKDLDHIMRVLGLRDFGIALEVGCHIGRVTPAITPLAREVWGMDLYDVSPAPVDQYFQVKSDHAGDNDYLPQIQTGSVDTLMVIDFFGFGHGQSWDEAMRRVDQRFWRFMSEGNFPRILKVGGYMVILQNESYPEDRLGKLSLAEANQRVDEFYGQPQLPYFEFAASGFCSHRKCPWIAYRRLK